MKAHIRITIQMLLGKGTSQHEIERRTGVATVSGRAPEHLQIAGRLRLELAKSDQGAGALLIVAGDITTAVAAYPDNVDPHKQISKAPAPFCAASKQRKER